MSNLTVFSSSSSQRRRPLFRPSLVVVFFCCFWSLCLLPCCHSIELIEDNNNVNKQQQYEQSFHHRLQQHRSMLRKSHDATLSSTLTTETTTTKSTAPSVLLKHDKRSVSVSDVWIPSQQQQQQSQNRHLRWLQDSLAKSVALPSTLASSKTAAAATATITGSTTTTTTTNASTVRTTDNTSFFTGEGAANAAGDEEYYNIAMQKCYDTLYQVAGDDDTSLSDEDYLVFLQQISGGQVTANTFSELSALFVLIFYTAACPYGVDCTPPHDDDDNAMRPAIQLHPDDDDNNNNAALVGLDFLCNTVLQYTYTTASLTFEFVIRYNTAKTDLTAAQVCLEQATNRLLLDQVGMCDISATTLTMNNNNDDKNNNNSMENTNGNNNNNRKRDLLRQKPMLNNNNDDHDWVTSQEKLRQQFWVHYSHSSSSRNSDDGGSGGRTLQSSSPSVDTLLLTEECQYETESTIQFIRDFPCDPPAASETIECALVRATTTMTVPQRIQPDSAVLRSAMVTTLRQAINTAGFEDYLSDDCLLTKRSGI